jgi:hypothetical protein
VRREREHGAEGGKRRKGKRGEKAKESFHHRHVADHVGQQKNVGLQKFSHAL